MKDTLIDNTEVITLPNGEKTMLAYGNDGSIWQKAITGRWIRILEIPDCLEYPIAQKYEIMIFTRRGFEFPPAKSIRFEAKDEQEAQRTFHLYEGHDWVWALLYNHLGQQIGERMHHT